MPPSYCPQSRRAVYPPRVLALIFLCRPPHVCNMFPVCPSHMIYPNDTVQSIWLSKWVQTFPVVSPFFFFYLSSTFLQGGLFVTFGCHWRNHPGKGSAAKVRTLNPAVVFVFSPQGSLAFFLLLSFFFSATHDDIWKTAPSCSVVAKWSQLTPTKDDTQFLRDWHWLTYPSTASWSLLSAVWREMWTKSTPRSCSQTCSYHSFKPHFRYSSKQI